MSEPQNTGSSAAATDSRPMRLRDALRQARIEAADRTGVVVDLRDAEVARLEILNEALDPLFCADPRQGRSVRSRHQPGRYAAAVDRRGRACDDGTRQADLSLRAGHPLRPHRARRIARSLRDRRCRHQLHRAPVDRARACAGGDDRSRRLRQPRAAEKPRRRRGGFWMFVLGFCSARWRCSRSRCCRACPISDRR